MLVFDVGQAKTPSSWNPKNHAKEAEPSDIRMNNLKMTFFLLEIF
jgi:hypothetical protein